MKPLIKLSLFVLLFLGIAINSQAQQLKESVRDTATQKVTLDIEGMVCNFCETNMKESLEEIKGVKKVEKVDAKEGVAILWLTEGKTVTDDQFKKAVPNAGFELKKVTRGHKNSKKSF
tara:strand:- start:2963 stop:3316 length:354 start_codon:yes stop_codon:yes gene_type:complete